MKKKDNRSLIEIYIEKNKRYSEIFEILAGDLKNLVERSDDVESKDWRRLVSTQLKLYGEILSDNDVLIQEIERINEQLEINAVIFKGTDDDDLQLKYYNN